MGGLLSRVAGVASIAALGLGVYEAIAKGEYWPAAICVAAFVVLGLVFLRTGEARRGSGIRQSQRSGKNSTNIQAARDISLGGGKRGR
jgi:hypothetical protein